MDEVQALKDIEYSTPRVVSVDELKKRKQVKPVSPEIVSATKRSRPPVINPEVKAVDDKTS